MKTKLKTLQKPIKKTDQKNRSKKGSKKCGTFKENHLYLTKFQTTCGFVYSITNTTNNRMYIGKKLFNFKRGKKKVPSDWQTYYGSNLELKNDVDTLGPEFFHREILYLCKNKSEMSYFEAKEQFVRDVLLSQQYYNSWIMCRIRTSHLKSLQT